MREDRYALKGDQTPRVKPEGGKDNRGPTQRPSPHKIRQNKKRQEEKKRTQIEFHVKEGSMGYADNVTQGRERGR